MKIHKIKIRNVMNTVQLNYVLLKSVDLEYYHLDVCLTLKTKVEFRITYFRGGKVNSG